MKFPLWRLLKQSGFRWYDADAPTLGASLAYYTLFALAPLLILAVQLVGLIAGEAAARGTLEAHLAAVFGDQVAPAVKQLCDSARGHDSTTKTILSLGAALIGAMTVFSQLQHAVDAVWETPSRYTGVLKLVHARFLAFSMVGILAALLLASLLADTALRLLGLWTAALSVPGLATLWRILDWAVPIVLSVALFVLLFKVLPVASVAWGDALVGAVFTASLFLLGNVLIGQYLAHSSVTSASGAAGSVVAILIWVYYSSQAVLLGAAFTRAYAEWRKESAQRRTPTA